MTKPQPAPENPPVIADAVKSDAPKVYQAICNVMADVGVEGIGKNRKATGSGANYAFRGIDDMYNALSGLLSKHKLCILPRAVDRFVTERVSKSGGALFYVVTTVEFDFVSAEDGSMHTVRMVGEAMDSGDKATNKAQSAAYKYAVMESFCIPTEGTGKDSEEDTYEVQGADQMTTAAPRAAAPAKKAAEAPAAAAPAAAETAPHDPETGELMPPHEIPVPTTNDVGDPDRWARIYIAALKGTPEKIEEWVKFNAKLMSQLMTYSPKAHAAVTKVLDTIRAAKKAA